LQNSNKNQLKKNAVTEIPTIRSAANDIIRLAKEEKDLKLELGALHNTKSSLLWLLNKSVALQRQRNSNL
jgi:hypothetical protein